MAILNFIRRVYQDPVGKVFLFILAIWGTYSLWHLYKEFSAQTPMVHVIAEFDVQGEYVKIDKKIRCYPEGQSGELLQQDFSLYFKFWKSGPRFYGDRRMLGAHLKDGRALLIYTPINACRDIWISLQRNDIKDNYVSENFVPSTALVYNFDKPSVIKYFSSKTAYLSETAEVKPISYVVKQAPKWSMWDFPDEFNWVSRSNGNPRYYRFESLEFMSVQAFEEKTEIALAEFGQEAPIMLKDIPGYEHPNNMWSALPHTITNVLAGRSSVVSEKTPGAIGVEYSVDNYYPLAIENGIFRPEFSQRGARIYYKLEKEDLKKSFKDQGMTLFSSLAQHHISWPDQIEIDQTLLDIIFYKSEKYDSESENRSTYFYWPKTNKVYKVKVSLRTLFY
ncbi:MAG: hypothetical protein V7723_08290 [Sneathiella sp.]|uniref:hypothetical protein n=1 Tax=Sneathiella sp. TaxID=1964365 RepID=UPI0030023166